MKRLRLIVPLTVAIFNFSAYARAVQEDLSATFKKGLDQITESSVGETLKYLASDELAGRGTGSREFQIAAKYVAQRFEKAGLKGGAKDGGYFHFKTIDLVRTPAEAVSVSDQEGKEQSRLQVLAAGAEAADVSGQCGRVDPNELDKLPENLKIAVLDVSGADGARRSRDGGWFKLSNAAVKLEAMGVVAIVAVVENGNPLIERAKQLAENATPANQRSRLAIPVLLASADQADQMVEVGSVAFHVPAQVVEKYDAQNVVGLLPGTDPELSRECVVFSAHLDHLGKFDNGQEDQIYNGADDDASGVTAVLTLAEAFAKCGIQPKRSILFVTFWGEESGLLGSRDFADSPPWDLSRMIANVNIEMIGRPEPGASEKIWMTGWDQSDLGTLMNEASKSIGVDIFNHPQFSAMLYRASDNWSLVQKGVIAHSFSAGSLHKDYHQPSDEFEKMNIPHMTRVVQGLFIGSTPMIFGDAKPVKAK